MEAGRTRNRPGRVEYVRILAQGWDYYGGSADLNTSIPA
jgi:hypothetical protein